MKASRKTPQVRRTKKVVGVASMALNMGANELLDRLLLEGNGEAAFAPMEIPPWYDPCQRTLQDALRGEEPEFEAAWKCRHGLQQVRTPATPHMYVSTRA